MHPDHALFFQYHRFQHCVLNVLPPTPPRSSDKFILFPLLPPELRLKIWQTIAQEPQTIELSCMFVSSNMSTGGRWFTHNSPPIIFSVCSESRAAAYYEYTLLDFSPEQIGQRWQTVFINWERDTLWLCNDLSATWAKDLFGKNEQLKENLKNLSVGENLWKAINPMGDGTATSPTGLKTKATDVVGKLRVLKGVEFHS